MSLKDRGIYLSLLMGVGLHSGSLTYFHLINSYLSSLKTVKEGHPDLLCEGWEINDWPLCISAVEAPLTHVPLLPATSIYILHLEPVDLILVSVGGGVGWVECLSYTPRSAFYSGVSNPLLSWL